MGAWGAAIAAGGAIVSGVISSKSDSRSANRSQRLGIKSFRKQWKYKAKRGLTPWEIAGTPTAHPGPASNTLGNNPGIRNAADQIGQQVFIAKQNKLDRENKLAIADKQQQAPLQQASTASAAQQLRAELQDHQVKQIQETTAALKQKRIQYWPTIFAKMGPDNVMAALATFNSGISLERVLTAQGNLTPEERKAVEQLYGKLLAARSILGKQVLTVKELADNVLNWVKGKTPLGKPVKKFQIESNYDPEKEKSRNLLGSP